MIRVIMTNEKGLVGELKAPGNDKTLLEIGKILFKDCPGNKAGK